MTKKLIVECARQEFLATGFRNASLRKIASAAQVSTGAIYGHFDKKALFTAATEEAAKKLKQKFADMADQFMTRAEQGASCGQSRGSANTADFYCLIYEYFDQS